MPFTTISIAIVWIVTFALLAVTVTSAASGPWLVLVVLAALAAPALLRRTRATTALPVPVAP